MIAGNNFKRNSSLPSPDPSPLGPWPDETQEQRAERAIGFNCLHYAAGNNEPSLYRHSLPTKDFLDVNCADGLRLEIFFPSCWNGQPDGGRTHNSHVAYPDGVQAGNCPKGYDRRLISLFYETIVATDQFKGKPGQFVLANGDPTGYGYHGDFIAAWKGTSLSDAIASCDLQNPSGDQSSCSVFTLTKNSDQCKMSALLPASIQNENVKGPIQGLPNGLQIYSGPGPAPNPAVAANDPAQSSPASSPAASNPAPPTSQNIVPTAHFTGPSAPVNTSLLAEPEIGQAHNKLAVGDPPPLLPSSTRSTVAASPPPSGFRAVSTLLKTSTISLTRVSPGVAEATPTVEEEVVVEEFVVVAPEDWTAAAAATGTVGGHLGKHKRHMHGHGHANGRHLHAAK